MRVPEVVVIDDDGKSLGVMEIGAALELAESKGLDLVEVSPSARPPVCKLLDYGRYRYEQAKKERKARSQQRTALLKEITLSPVTAEHDIDIKAKAVINFLRQGKKVMVAVRFRRGRQLDHQELGQDVLAAIEKRVAAVQVGSVERAPSLDGQRLSMLFAPAQKSRRS